MRAALGIGVAVVVLAAVGITGRVLAPDPTSDPCAAVPSGPVGEFFAGAGEAQATRLTLPGSSTQRCVWMLRSEEVGAGQPELRSLRVTFGLADGEGFLDRVSDRAERDSVGGGERPDRRTVTAVESSDEATTFRLATVQSGRTEGAKDVVVELAAYAMPSSGDVGRIRELVTAMSDELRPLRETALRASPGTATRMLADAGANVQARLQDEGLEPIGSSGCAAAPPRLLADMMGEYVKLSGGTSCLWYSGRGDGSKAPADGAPAGTVIVRGGTADDALTARNAFAELSFVNNPHTWLESYDPRPDLGAGTQTRILSGLIGMDDGEPDVSRSVGIVEVAAIRDRTVVVVKYIGANVGDRPENERKPLRLTRALLDRL